MWTRSQLPDRAARRSGASLLEVMIAMVILSVGLLALQAFAMSAVRSLALAERTTRSSAAAVTSLEQAIGQLLLDSIPADLECLLQDGSSFRRDALEEPALERYRVSVSLTPPPSHSALRPIYLETIVRSSGAIYPAADPGVCP
jgi:type II secretory pathway pseudopilin PulG